MRALSDALPTGHRAMANPTLQLHFGCGRATPPVSHSHNWPSRRMQNFLFKIGQKSYFFANKDPKTNFDDWMILQKHVLSFKCSDFFKMANLKAISSSATLSGHCMHRAYASYSLLNIMQWITIFVWHGYHSDDCVVDGTSFFMWICTTTACPSFMSCWYLIRTRKILINDGDKSLVVLTPRYLENPLLFLKESHIYSSHCL